MLGTGYSTGTVFKSEQYLRSLKGKTIIAFQAAFRNLYDLYMFLPDVWMWSDPHSSLEGLEMILANKEIFREKPLQIVIPNYCDSSFRNEHQLFAGSSPVWRDATMYDLYYSMLEKVKDVEGVKVLSIQVYTTKYMVTSPRKTKDCKNIFKNPVERFILDRPIIN